MTRRLALRDFMVWWIPVVIPIQYSAQLGIIEPTRERYTQST